MQIPSIFRRSEEEQAPEVEVQGEDIVIRNKQDGDEPKKEVRAKMPKTKWA
jgi:hypothetical protein